MTLVGRKAADAPAYVIRLDVLEAYIDSGRVLSGRDLHRARPGECDGTWVIRTHRAHVRFPCHDVSIRNAVVQLRKNVVFARRQIRNTIFAQIINLAAPAWVV